MKKYLITGCAGFIGSNFVYYMLEKYKDILLVNLDKLTYAGNLENLKGIENDSPFRQMKMESHMESLCQAGNMQVWPIQ